MYFDYLRVAATISVVVLHVSAQNWYSFNGRSFEWNVFNFYDSIVRWGVPIFLMISGSLFLYRDIEIKNLYRKYILRLFVAYCFWALFYAVYSPIIDSIIGKGFALPIKSIIKNTISGNYHMWFIPMIIGTYMCILL
jgi:surface polysaccharide O-acyltransferase-like enzyme